MSTVGRRGGPKHQNETAWNPSRFKTDSKTKAVQSLVVTDCCQRCTDIIEWKIRYGKYRPLSAPAKCSICGEKKIKSAYHTRCKECRSKAGVCAKCGQSAEPIVRDADSVATRSDVDRIRSTIDHEIKELAERKRRTVMREVAKLPQFGSDYAVNRDLFANLNACLAQVRQLQLEQRAKQEAKLSDSDCEL